MTSIVEVLGEDHRRCDALFSEAEQAVGRLDWDGAAQRFRDFRQAIEHHFGAEEGVLFPAFEAHTGSRAGPTEVMRMEHAEMRDVLAQMQGCLSARDAESYLGLSETLLILMQQHNAKEEQVLYRMADRALGPGPAVAVTRALAVGERE